MPFLYHYYSYLYDSKFRLYCTGCKVILQKTKNPKWGADHNAALLQCPRCGKEIFMESNHGKPMAREEFIERIKKHHKTKQN